MTIRPVLFCLLGVVSLSLCGCSGDSTDVSKKVNDDYHNRVAGPPPAPGAMNAPGNSVGPFANSGGVPPGQPAAPYNGAGVGPGGAPAGAGAAPSGGAGK